MISKENNLDMVSSMISPINDTHPPKYGVVIPNRIFVGGIPTQTLENELSKFFSEYGSVKDVKIIYDRAGISKGYGFVTFESEEDVKKVNSMSDSLSFKDRKLNVGPAIKKQQSNMTTATKIMQAATIGACAFGPGGSLATNGMFEATQNIHFQGGATHHYFPALGSLNGTATTILLPSYQQNQAAAANQLIFHPQQQTLPSNNLMMSNANANGPLFGNNMINPQYLQQQNVVHQTTPAPSGLIPLGFHAASSPLGASTTPQPQHIVIGGGAQPISNSAQSTAAAFDGNPGDKMMQQSPSINNEYLNNWLAAYAATGQNQNYGLPGFGTPTPMTPTAYVLQPNPNMNVNNNNITNFNGGIYPTHHQKSNSNSNSIQYQSNGALSENGIVNNTNGANSLSSGISSPITNNSNQDQLEVLKDQLEYKNHLKMNLPIIYAAQPIFMPTLPLTPNIANHTMLPNAYPTPLSSQQRANMIPAGAYFFATPSPLPHNAGQPTPPQSGNNTTTTTLVMNDNKCNGYGSFFPIYAAGSAPPTPLIMGGQMSLTNTAVASTTNTTVLLTSSSMSSQGNSNNESLGSANSEIGDKKENGPENGLLPCVANANNTVLIGSENGTTIAHNSSKAVTLSTTLNTVNSIDKAKHFSTKNAAEMSETNGFSDEKMAQCNKVRCASNSNFQMIDDKNENYYGYYEVGGGKENGEEQGDNVFITSADHNFAAQHAHKFVGENGFFYHPNGASEPLYHENNLKYLDTTKKYCYGNLSSAFNHNNDNSNFSNGHYDRNQYVAENAFENSENINNNGITNDGLVMISTPNGFVHNKNLNGLKSGAMKIPISFTSENGLEMKNGCFPSSSIHFNGANDQNEYPPNAFDIVNNVCE